MEKEKGPSLVEWIWDGVRGSDRIFPAHYESKTGECCTQGKHSADSKIKKRKQERSLQGGEKQ